MIAPTNFTCGECGETFNNEEEGNKHMSAAHGEKVSEKTSKSPGDHKCHGCNNRTNLALHYLQHVLNNHISDEFAGQNNNMKPVDAPVVYMLDEQNMALIEEIKSLRKDLDYINKVLRQKSTQES